MLRREADNGVAPAERGALEVQDQGTDVALDRHLERALERLRIANVEHDGLQARGTRRLLDHPAVRRIDGVAEVKGHAEAAPRRQQLAQNVDALRRQVEHEVRHAGDIATGMGEALDDARADRIA